MKKVKITYNGEEMELVTKLDEEDVILSNEDLDDTLDLTEEISKMEVQKDDTNW